MLFRSSLEHGLELLVRTCKHDWDKVVHDPIPGYRTPGDAPGTMGIDWQGPQYVGPQDRWRRAVLRWQTGNPAGAKEDLRWLIDKQPEGVNLDRVEELYRSL